MTELEEYVVKAKSGDKESFAKAFEIVQPDIRKYAIARIKNYDDLEDVLQNTIVKAFKYINTLKDPHYFKTWFIRILINECNSYYKHSTPEYEIIDNLDYSKDDEYCLYDTNDLSEDLDFDRLIKDLKDDEKKILTLYYKNNYTAPQISKILDMNLNTVKSKMKRSHDKLRKILPLTIILLCIVTITSAIAIQIIKKLFNNSHSGIDTAVENGYVQNVDMDYIYYNNLGVKVDYLLVDDQNIDISFVYNYTGTLDGELKEVNMLDYVITDENDNVIYTSDPIKRPISNSALLGNDFTYINKTTISNSLLITYYYNYPTFKTLYVDISEIELKTDKDNMKINGDWSFCIQLDTMFVNRTSYNYNVSDSEYVSNVSAKLTSTSLEIELKLKNKIIHDLIYNPENIKLKDKNGKSYTYIEYHYTENDNTVKLIYPITLYDNIQQLEMYISIDNKSITHISLF